MSSRYPLPREVSEYHRAAHNASRRPNDNYYNAVAREAARSALSALESAYDAVVRKLEEHERAGERAYDAHVTSPDYGGCSCHINPPCSWCIDQPDPDAEAVTP